MENQPFKNIGTHLYIDLIIEYYIHIKNDSVGGTIEMMDWDPSGQRLAVTFKSLNYFEIFINIYNYF